MLRTFDTIIAASAAPTPVKTVLTNILAIMTLHWSLLPNPSQLSPLLRLRFGAQYAFHGLPPYSLRNSAPKEKAKA